METQKQNFKAINFVFSKCSFLQRLFKRISIAFDGMPAAINQSGASESGASHHPSHDFTSSTNGHDAIGTDPSYQGLFCNIYHRD